MVTKKYDIAIIDASNLYWKRHIDVDDKYIYMYEQRPISSTTIKNFLTAIEQFQKFYLKKDSDIYFLFDNPNSRINERKSIDPLYKHTRDSIYLSPDVYPTLNLIKNLLPKISDKFHIGFYIGLEADDLTKPLKICLKGLNKNILFISDDLDWSRNIDENSEWYDGKVIYNADNYTITFGFYPTENKIKMFKSLSGDASDCIPSGCPNIPKKLLLDIINRYDNLNILYENLHNDSTINGHWRNSLQINRDRIYLNMKLVSFIEKNLSYSDFIIDGKKDSQFIDQLFSVLKINTHYFFL